MGFLDRGSNSLPPTRGSVSSLAGFGAESRPTKGFPPFSALRMASPDTVILLIVDYRAATGEERPPCPLPLVYAPICHLPPSTTSSVAARTPHSIKRRRLLAASCQLMVPHYCNPPQHAVNQRHL